jgi:ATP-dependent DNA helicase 2 subunit 1
VFLFTAEDNPHPPGDEDRQPSIKRAQELAAKNVQIELFPIRKTRKCNFDVRKFYQEIITFDPDEINSTVLDSSSKILDLQERLRQKEFKKRTLNRLTLKIGKELNEGE